MSERPLATALLVNPQARAGRGLPLWTRWQKEWAMHPHLRTRQWVAEASLQPGAALSAWVTENLNKGLRHFVAVGGDGTVHALLNALVQAAEGVGLPLREISLGAVGIGSSNDFHKPFAKVLKEQHGLPVRLDGYCQQEHDVARFTEEASGECFYFINNASLGLTAVANDFFNHPNRTLAWLKKKTPPLAILYSALRTLRRYRNLPLHLRYGPGGTWQRLHLSNLGVVKNPHFAGSFRYERLVAANDQQLGLHLCHGLQGFEYLTTLAQLAQGRLPSGAKALNRKVAQVKFRSAHPLAVELDGEIYRSAAGAFDIYEQRIQLCGPSI